MSKMDATVRTDVGVHRKRFAGKSDEPTLASLRRWNKNVLRDENDDNDVVVVQAAAQEASPRTSPRVRLARQRQPFAHIRRPLRRSEHKCSVRLLDTFDL
jgi:hypothetical protein